MSFIVFSCDMKQWQVWYCIKQTGHCWLWLSKQWCDEGRVEKSRRSQDISLVFEHTKYPGRPEIPNSSVNLPFQHSFQPYCYDWKCACYPGWLMPAACTAAERGPWEPGHWPPGDEKPVRLCRSLEVSWKSVTS